MSTGTPKTRTDPLFPVWLNFKIRILKSLWSKKKKEKKYLHCTCSTVPLSCIRHNKSYLQYLLFGQFLVGHTFNIFVRAFFFFQIQDSCGKGRSEYKDLKLSLQTLFERSIFQTFWKTDSCPNFLLLELETLIFGYFWFLVSGLGAVRSRYWSRLFSTVIFV